jgi:nitroreductase
VPVIIPGEQSQRLAEMLRIRQLPIPGPGTTRAQGRQAPAGQDAAAAGHHTWLPGSIDDTLARRHSVRAFTTDPLPRSTICAAATAARDAEAAAWPAGTHGAGAFQIIVAAFRVDGLAKGLHAIRTGPDATPLGPEIGPEIGTEIGPEIDTDNGWLESLGKEYVDAPALLLICGDLNAACRDGGPTGYASMLVRAGTIGYAAWLWAVSAGLAGSVYGPACHRVTGAARQLDANLRHLFTVAIGASAEPAGHPSGNDGHDGLS